MASPVRRGDVVLVSLDPPIGSEIRKTRPCLVISPDDLNEHLGTIIVAPMTTGGNPYPFRIACRFQGRSGQVVVDQVRAIDRSRAVRVLGRLPEPPLTSVLLALQEMFHP